MRTVDVINALGALAHEYRLAIYRLLVEQGPRGLPAGAIGEKGGLGGAMRPESAAEALRVSPASARRSRRS